MLGGGTRHVEGRAGDGREQDEQDRQRRNRGQDPGQDEGDLALADEQVQCALSKPGGGEHRAHQVPKLEEECTEGQAEQHFAQRAEAVEKQADGPQQEVQAAALAIAVEDREGKDECNERGEIRQEGHGNSLKNGSPVFGGRIDSPKVLATDFTDFH